MPQLVNDDGKPLCPNCSEHPELFSDGACPVCDFIDDEINAAFMEELHEADDYEDEDDEFEEDYEDISEED